MRFEKTFEIKIVCDIGNLKIEDILLQKAFQSLKLILKIYNCFDSMIVSEQCPKIFA